MGPGILAAWIAAYLQNEKFILQARSPGLALVTFGWLDAFFFSTGAAFSFTKFQHEQRFHYEQYRISSQLNKVFHIVQEKVCLHYAGYWTTNRRLDND